MRIFRCSVAVMLLLIQFPVSRAAAQLKPSALLFVRMDAVKKYRGMYSHDPKHHTREFSRFLRKADSLLQMKPLSVMEKKQTPPSGDKHDFMSMGPYWWPDTTKPNGLPYIRKDGQRNPEYYTIPDQLYFGNVVTAAEFEALAYTVTNKEKYAEKAVQLLRVWFLDPKTKMNPNLNHAQYIPGINTGRGIGIIETRYIYKILDAVSLLRTSSAWKPKDDAMMTQWLGQYFRWLTTHQYGIDESNEKNNHGTWYDVQKISLALFLGKPEIARTALELAKGKRISAQIEPDGSQPLELARTRSWSYSVMNLTAMFHLATLGEHAGVDLWSYRSDSGASLGRALEYLLPYVGNMGTWKYQQISGIETEPLFRLVEIAKLKYGSEKYSTWQKELDRIGSAGTVESTVLIY
jgi:hypothetical protein